MSRSHHALILFISGAVCMFVVDRMLSPDKIITIIHNKTARWQIPSEKGADDFGRRSRLITTVYRFDGKEFQQLHEFCTWTVHMDCVGLKTDMGTTPIHIHDTKVDQWVSGNLKKSGTWEAGNIRLIISLLQKDPELGFMDLGSHVGAFSLSVAKFGRKVVSVDPLIENVQRLCKSIQKGGLTANMTIIFNPLSDKHVIVDFKRESGNIGGTSIVEARLDTSPSLPCEDRAISYTTTLDDLLPFLPFKKAVLKMDVQEHEYRVLKGSVKFFQQIAVPAILMEWVLMKNITDAQKIINVLMEYNFKAYEPKINGLALDPAHYKTWPYDILWIRS